MNSFNINVSDSNLKHLLNSENDMVQIKQQILDAIMAAENKNILIGLDISDVLDLFKDYTELHIGIVRSKITAEADEIVEKLIDSIQTDISACNKVYLYIKGDVSLMDVNDVAQALEHRLGEAVEILFTGTYDASKVGEYEVLVVFLQ